MSYRYLIKTLLTLAALFLSAAPLSAQVLTISGDLPMDLSQNYFDMNVSITRVPSANKEAGDTESTANDESLSAATRLKVSVGSNTQEILFDFEQGAQSSDKEYYLVLRSSEGPTTDDDVSTQFQYNYGLRVYDLSGNGTNLKSDVGSKGYIEVSIQFYLGESLVIEEEDVQIEQADYAATQTPTFASPAIVGKYESMAVFYNATDTITTTAGSKTATNLNLVVVDTAVVTGDTTLPAKIYEESADDETPTYADETCDFLYDNINGGSCISCPTDSNVFLDMDAIDAIDGFQVVSATASSDSKTITDLENRGANDPVYVVFGQYDPLGLARSVCMPGRPSTNNTMTEINGAGDAKVLDLRCFIASATYGSPFHKTVNLFRAFRDRFLLQIPGGQWVVDTYYQLSPPLAKAIAQNRWLKASAQAALALPAAILDIFYDDDEEPVLP